MGGTFWPHDHMRSHENISSSGGPMATKFGRVVTYDKGNSPIMSNDPLITWSHEVTWQIKNLISPLLRGLWTPNMKGGDLWWEEPTYGVMILWNVVMCSHVTESKVTCPLWQDLRPWNLVSWWLMVRWKHLWSHMFLWPPGHMSSRDKLKAK